MIWSSSVCQWPDAGRMKISTLHHQPCLRPPHKEARLMRFCGVRRGRMMAVPVLHQEDEPAECNYPHSEVSASHRQIQLIISVDVQPQRGTPALPSDHRCKVAGLQLNHSLYWVGKTTGHSPSILVTRHFSRLQKTQTPSSGIMRY